MTFYTISAANMNFRQSGRFMSLVFVYRPVWWKKTGFLSKAQKHLNLY